MKARLARSNALSATRIASGKRFATRSVSSLSLRVSHSFCSPFITLPTLAELGDQVSSNLFRRHRQRLPLLCDYIIASEITRGPLHFTRWADVFPVPAD